MDEATWAKHCDNACAAAQAGNYSLAEDCWRLAWANAKSLEENDPRHLMTMEYFADVLCLREKFEEAEQLLRNLLEIKIRLMGDSHVRVGSTHNTLAGLYFALKQYENAEKHCKRALEIHELSEGRENPDIVMITYNLAMVYHAQQRYEHAGPHYVRSMELARKVYGAEHAETANITEHYMALLNASGKKDEAMKVNKTLVLPIYDRLVRTVGGETPPPATNKGFAATTLTGMKRDPRKSNQCMYKIKPLPASADAEDHEH